MSFASHVFGLRTQFTHALSQPSERYRRIKAYNIMNLQLQCIQELVLTKCYAHHPWFGMDSGSEENNLFHHRRFSPGLSPCLLRDLSPCTAKTYADNIQTKIHTKHSCSKIFSLSQLPKTECIQDVSLTVTVSIIRDDILN